MTALKSKPLGGLLAGLLTVGTVGYSAGQPGAPAKARVLRIPSPRDGILLAVGTEVDRPAAGGPQVFEVRVGNQSRFYRRLVEGDKVTEGQMLAQLDDRAARAEVEQRKAKLTIARAGLAAAAALHKEAQARLDRLRALLQRVDISVEEHTGAVLTRDKHRQAEVVKKLGVKLAQLELERAQLILEMHTIRSPVNGVVRRILKRPGEAVRKLEPLFEIQTADSD